jgi:hypothetical protein
LRFFKWRDDAPRRREPTAEERAAFEEMLLEQDLEGALVQAKDYAMKRTRDNETMADQMVRRARTILWERCSWDPQKVPLAAYLKGIIRSEISHDAEAGVKRTEEEQEWVVDMDTVEGAYARTPEELMIERDESVEGREKAASKLEEMRKHFEATGDRVNLEWIEYSLDDIEDPAEMARRSGRKVEEFYRARDRRVRYVERLLAARRGGSAN